MTTIDQTNHTAVRCLTNDEIDAVAGAGIQNFAGAASGFGCFGIPGDNGHGGIIYTSPTVGRLPWPLHPF
jgi:hypothetical protein